MRCPFTLTNFSTVAEAYAILSGCATTTVSVTPSPQTPVYDSAMSALVLWAPHWRPDQKDIPKQEAAAETGLKEFLQTSDCFKSAELRGLPSMTPTVVAAEVTSTNGLFNKVIVITLREFGPVVKLLSSLTLIGWWDRSRAPSCRAYSIRQGSKPNLHRSLAKWRAWDHQGREVPASGHASCTGYGPATE
mgnify:CR=1 FL=1